MKKYLSLRWVLTTLLVILGVAVLIRLGIWQLDRLAWRREFNARVITQLSAPALDLNQEQPVSDLFAMEYRTVIVRGVYDFTHEVFLRNQAWDGQPGYRVLTPLLIDGSSYAVLIDRGWIPFESGHVPLQSQYNEPGRVEVTGQLRRPEEKPDFGGVPDPTLAPGQTVLEVWNVVNVKRIQAQNGLNLLPAWVQAAPDPTHTGLPYRALPEIEITEGSHLSYAFQWFTFAAILGVGYPFFVRRQVNKTTQPGDEDERESVQDDGVESYVPGPSKKRPVK